MDSGIQMFTTDSVSTISSGKIVAQTSTFEQTSMTDDDPGIRIIGDNKVELVYKNKVTNEEASFGVEIIDIRIGRTDLTEQVSNNVYQRMRSEREKEANLLRAEGEELSKEIVASADRQQTVILAEAERTSSILRGEGDAGKNRILGDAYSLDEEFFDFLRTMQACKDTFGDTEMSMVIAPGEVCEKFFGEIDLQN